MIQQFKQSKSSNNSGNRTDNVVDVFHQENRFCRNHLERQDVDVKNRKRTEHHTQNKVDDFKFLKMKITRTCYADASKNIERNGKKIQH
jgi:hypothetical protein